MKLEELTMEELELLYWETVEQEEGEWKETKLLEKILELM